uniref:WAT1-related protein n=1 Tax=Tetraselmis chuii TaxID=63592 RepID=A0A7S1SRI1_9CHLO
MVCGVLLFNQFLFATMHNVSHAALAHIPFMAFAAFRMLLSLPFLAIVAHQERKRVKGSQGIDIDITPRVILWTMGCGFTGVMLAQTLVLAGNDLAGPSITAITQPAIPVYTSVIAGLLRVERFTWPKMVGVLLAVGGALVLLHVERWATVGAFTSQKSIGTLILVVQTLSYSSFLVMFSAMSVWFPYPFTAFFLCTLWAAFAQMFLAFPTFVAFYSAGPVPLYAWGAVVYCAVGVSFVAHTGQAWSVRHLNSTIPSLFGCLQPPLTIAMAILFLGESLELVTDLTGMSLILVGMLMVIFFKRMEMRTAASGSDPLDYAKLSNRDGGAPAGEMDVELVATEDLKHERGGLVKDGSDVSEASGYLPSGLSNPMHNPFDTSMCLATTIRVHSMRNVRQASGAEEFVNALYDA